MSCGAAHDHGGSCAGGGFGLPATSARGPGSCWACIVGPLGRACHGLRKSLKGAENRGDVWVYVPWGVALHIQCPVGAHMGIIPRLSLMDWHAGGG